MATRVAFPEQAWMHCEMVMGAVRDVGVNVGEDWREMQPIYWK
jgi:hypothetical protein